MSIAGTQDGIDVSGATYSFEMRPVNDLPTNAVIVITKPAQVGVDNINTMVMTCSSGCTAGTLS